MQHAMHHQDAYTQAMRQRENSEAAPATAPDSLLRAPQEQEAAMSSIQSRTRPSSLADGARGVDHVTGRLNCQLSAQLITHIAIHRGLRSRHMRPFGSPSALVFSPLGIRPKDDEPVEEFPDLYDKDVPEAGPPDLLEPDEEAGLEPDPEDGQNDGVSQAN